MSELTDSAQIAPTRWDADVVAADGGIIHLRPIVPADADRLIAFHNSLSLRSRYLRFFFIHDALTQDEVRHYTNVDLVDRFGLVATLRDTTEREAIIGVGRWDRAPGDDEAEIAFVIADAHQGRGIASILLEHLAAAGRELGVTRFAATVLAENHAMLRVFREAGYQTRSSGLGAQVELDFAIEETEATQRVMAEREQHAEARSVARLLAPRSVAVLGACADTETIGGAAFAALLRGRFNGPLYPVNDAREHVHGVRAYPSLDEVPGAVDLAVLAVPATQAIEAIAHAARHSVRAAVVMSGGFGEDGDPQGRQRQRDMLRLARSQGMRIVGPNCLGIANTDPEVQLNATLAPVMPLRGRNGFFCQSGALGVAMLAEARRRGLGISTFVSAGNRADVSGNDLLQYWETDPATDVVLMYLESFGNPRKFARVARRLARRKPVVVVKSRRAAPPESLAGTTVEMPESSVQALFQSAGVVRVDTITELFDVAQILSSQPRPAGDRVAVVGNSAALARIVLDALAAEGLSVVRVVDVGAAAPPDACGAALRDALADEAVDAAVALFVPLVQRASGDEFASAVEAASVGAGKPVIATFMDSPGGHRVGAVPSFVEPERGVQALARVMRYSRWRDAPPARLPDSRGLRINEARAVLAEALAPDGAASRAAAGAGPASADPRAADPQGADPRAADPRAAVGAPSWLDEAATRAVLDAVGIDIVHGAASPASAASANQADRADPASADPASAHPAALDVALSLQDDPAFGSVLSFGLDGPIAAALDTPSYAVVPLTVADAARLIGQSRGAPLLRDREVDLAAIEDLALRLSMLADEAPQIAAARLAPITIDPASGRPIVRAARIGVRRPAGVGPPGPRRMRAL